MRVLKQFAGTGTFRGLPLLLFAYAALMTHFIFGRAFRDSLLGSELAIQSLPSLTMWSTLVSIILSLTVSNLFRSRPRKRIACAGFALNLIIELLFASASPRFARGWTQGYPKRLGQVFQTRYYAATGKAGPALAAGSKFAGSATSAGQRLAEGIVTLREPVKDMSALATAACRESPALPAPRGGEARQTGDSRTGRERSARRQSGAGVDRRWLP